ISCAGQINSYVDCYKPYERPSYYANGGTSYNANRGTSYNINRETVSHVKKETSSYANENNHSLAQNVPADEASELSDIPATHVPTHVAIPIDDFLGLLKSALSKSNASKDEIS
ncbi:17287_t:CDS:1, partial [Gigaspora rosea]